MFTVFYAASNNQHFSPLQFAVGYPFKPLKGLHRKEEKHAEFIVFKKSKNCIFMEKPKSYLVYFPNGKRMQGKLECDSSHLKPAHTVAAFQ